MVADMEEEMVEETFRIEEEVEEEGPRIVIQWSISIATNSNTSKKNVLIGMLKQIISMQNIIMMI